MTHHEQHEDDPAVDQLPDARAVEGEERPSESSPNPTQERIDEDPETNRPVDVEWENR